MAEAISRYERHGDTDGFLIGIVGEAGPEYTNSVAVTLLSADDDPVGVIQLCVTEKHEDENEHNHVLLDGNEAAMLALILQNAALQFHERVLSHEWTSAENP
jgi:hypothetical protein